MKKSGRNRNIGKKKNEKITALAIISLIAVILLSGLLIKFSADKQELLGQISGLEGSVSHIREDESSKNAENDDEIKGLKESLSRAESEKIERENEIKKRDEKIKELEETNKKLQEMKKQREEEKKKPKPLPVPSGDKTVYLTFDDGPSAQTPKVLAVLKEYNVKATFFVTDIEPRYRSYMKDIVAGGHAIGLHTASHSYSDIYSSPENYFKDLNRISDIVEKETGVKSKIIRFPGGGSNTISRSYSKGIMTELARETAKKGYVYFDWNCASGDATGNGIPAYKLVENVKATDPGSRNIVVLMHDAYGKKTTPESLPGIIEYFSERGYSFGVLTENVPPVHHKIAN